MSKLAAANVAKDERDGSERGLKDPREGSKTGTGEKRGKGEVIERCSVCRREGEVGVGETERGFGTVEGLVQGVVEEPVEGLPEGPVEGF